ncbi:DnaJ domain-containing protein [Campylobacter sp. 19-13652]|uniref:DnaJ domain-containing protein n=1 Tax=Campylobacter sp. 19-13652 TaxID=2840180 RepID=UPI001C763E35|nr:DnaJ domain-containing protein [Campylobacter sp. 19-13652]BCX79541.1 molecular chaperone DjlA [Campylobacter sp. 19-13652]
MSYLWIFFIAVVAFYFLSASSRKSNAARRANSGQSAHLLVGMIAKVAKSDGVVSDEEADLIGQILSDFSANFGISRDALKSTYEREKTRLDNARNLALEYRFNTGADTNEATGVLAFLLNLAYVDGVFSQGEKKILTEIAYGLGLNDAQKSVIFARFEAEFNNRFSTQEKKSPYEVLGISQNVDQNEVKRRYKELVRENHPDLLMGKGASESVVSEATKKLQEINEAYENIKKQRGWA